MIAREVFRLFRPTQAVVDLGAITRNARAVRAGLAPQVKLMAMVKADGYGHGMVPAARAALVGGAQALGVALLEEGIALRQAGITCPILVVGPTFPGCEQEAIARDILLSVFCPDQVARMERAAARMDRVARVHIKVDTGMNRIGAHPGRELTALLTALAAAPHVEAAGMFTHLATADMPDASRARAQCEAFIQAEAMLADYPSLHPDCRHVCASSAIYRFPQMHRSMVRLGVGLYGGFLYPQAPAFEPAMRLVSAAALVKPIDAGDAVGYGATWVSPGPRRIATVPVGYGDGYFRCLSNRAAVLIRGARCPIVGRICMDQMMVDVTAVPQAAAGDEVVLIGRQGEDEITARELADLAGTIDYEVFTHLTARVPRVYRHG